MSIEDHKAKILGVLVRAGATAEDAEKTWPSIHEVIVGWRAVKNGPGGPTASQTVKMYGALAEALAAARKATDAIVQQFGLAAMLANEMRPGGPISEAEELFGPPKPGGNPLIRHTLAAMEALESAAIRATKKSHRGPGAPSTKGLASHLFLPLLAQLFEGATGKPARGVQRDFGDFIRATMLAAGTNKSLATIDDEIDNFLSGNKRRERKKLARRARTGKRKSATAVTVH